MKKFIAFLALACGLAAAPTTPINNANIQLNGVSQTGVLAGNTTGAATATQAQISTAFDLLGSTRGSVLYRGASGWSILAPSTNGYVLRTNGAGLDPSWALESGLGTVTSFSAGGLSPLFTTNVATSTTTPALTFTLSNAAINTIYAGPTSGSPAPPTFRSLVAADILPINLASSANGGVTGNLPVTNLNSGTSASGSTFWRGDGTWGVPAGTGVTAVSVATANGLAGTSSGGTTPALTLSTTVTGILKGDGTAISAATSGSDYAPATTGGFVLSGNSAGGFANSDMTYSTPTLSVPDAFNISSAGSVSITGGGSNKGINILPSGNGGVGIGMSPLNGFTRLAVYGLSATTVPDFNVWSTAPVCVFDEASDGLNLNAAGSVRPILNFRRSKGTLIAPTAVADTDTLGQIIFRGYSGSAFAGVAGIAGVADGTPASGFVPIKVLITSSDASGNSVNGITVRASGGAEFSNASIPSVATSPGTAGGNLFLVSLATGGATTITDTGVGGTGGAVLFGSGTGGTANTAITSSTGGAGGLWRATSGAGGASAVTGGTNGTGGKGGGITFNVGNGGAVTLSTGTNLGGAGGDFTQSSGNGGNASGGSSNTGGAGGAINIATGSGGTGATATGSSGTLTLKTGTSGTGGTVGSIILQAGNVTGYTLGALNQSTFQPTAPASVATSPGTSAGNVFVVTGAVGGATSIATTGIGGIGGAINLTAGNGGTAASAVTTSTGGAGGLVNFGSGLGGAAAVSGSGDGNGGTSGTFSIFTGAGGAVSTSTGVNTGGNSGALTAVTGAGGAATNGSSNTGGTSGNVVLATGNGGAGATTTGNSGTVTIRTGSGGTAGSIFLASGGVTGFTLGALNQVILASVQPASIATTPGTSTGAGLAYTGAAGGNTSIATTGTGGQGNVIVLSAGAGGTAASAVTASTGGNGGSVAFGSGAGAVAAVAGSGTGTGGNGGGFSESTGAGGAASTSTGVNLGGNSGAWAVTTGNGGAATSGSTNTGGNAGNITLTTGNGGAGATAAGNSGTLNLVTGTAGSGGTVGNIIFKVGNVQTLAVSGGAAATLTGGAGNMTITAGTGASRTLTLQTTTSGSSATTFLSGDASQNTTISKLISSYNGISTAGNGVVAIVKATRVTAQSAANSSICTYTTPASDGSYEVSANMNVTASTTLSTTLTCTYTDESNTARSLILPVTGLTGSFVALGSISGAGASVWETPVMHIRCKASTVITILTSAGTFSGVTYTAEGIIKQTQ